MKFHQAISLALSAYSCGAFSPVSHGTSARQPFLATRSMVTDPSLMHDLPNHMNSFHQAFSSLSLADMADGMAPMTDMAPAAADAAAQGSGNGFFGILTEPTEFLLQGVHSALTGVGLTSNTWGITIIFITLLIKAVTFPLTKTQLESTNKMQAIQPKMKEVQAKYQSNPEVMNQKIAELYQANDVNPLAGCLPSLVQIPVFIGLYRAVLDLAKENQLDEPFLFLPNLEGPMYGAPPQEGAQWLLGNWVDGVPSLGWDDTISFLILPVFLVVSQFVSMELMSPKDNPQAQNNIVLKLLPLLIGWFSLSVPAALSVYWVTNNIVTTATSVIIRNTMKSEPIQSVGASTAAATSSPEIFAPSPLNQEVSGFGGDDDVKPITGADAVIDAEVVPENSGVAMGDVAQQNRGSKKKRKKKRRKN